MTISRTADIPTRRLLAIALLVIAPVIAAQPAQAQTVKKWVDEDGVTHYSDQLPPGGGTEVREMEIPRDSVTEFESQDVNQRVDKQLQELERAREAREQEREAEKRTRDLEKALEREPIVETEKKKKDRDRPYSGPYPKPPPGPFPEQYPRAREQRGNVAPPEPANQSN